VNKYERSILFVPQVTKALALVICGLNLVAPLYRGFAWHFSVFQILAVAIWIFAALTATGHFCKNLHTEQDGMMLYEQNLSPVVILIGLNRIIEVAYYFLFRRVNIQWAMIGFLVVVDVFFLIFLYVDKMHYGYAKEITTEENFDVDKNY